MWAHPGKQLLFMGSEFGQESEWAGVAVAGLVAARPPRPPRRADAGRATSTGSTRETPALWSARLRPRRASSWIDANDAGGNTFSFLRSGRPTARALACVANFSGVPHEGYRIGLPLAGRWDEVLNTDAEVYAGSGVGNLGAVEASDEAWHGRPASATCGSPRSARLAAAGVSQ